MHEKENGKERQITLKVKDDIQVDVSKKRISAISVPRYYISEHTL
jgi:hypothetical protein